MKGTHVNVVEEVQAARHVLRDVLSLMVPRQLPPHLRRMLPGVTIQRLSSMAACWSAAAIFECCVWPCTDEAVYQGCQALVLKRCCRGFSYLTERRSPPSQNSSSSIGSRPTMLAP